MNMRMRPLAIRSLVLGLAAGAALAGVQTPAHADELALPGAAAEAAPSATAAAPDARLRSGCHAYTVRYEVADADEDWQLTLEILDRRDRGVAHVNLHGVSDPRKGRTTFTVCRSAVKAGKFTVTGVLADRDGYDQTEYAVEGDRFWLTRG